MSWHEVLLLSRSQDVPLLTREPLFCHFSFLLFLQVALDTGELSCYLATRSIPTGALVYELDYPIRSFRQIAVTADGLFLVIPSIEGIKVSCERNEKVEGRWNEN